MQQETIENLVMKIQSGDTSLFPVLWERLERLFFLIVRKTMEKRKKPVWIDQEDIMQSCFLALSRAVDQYQPKKGYQFTSYLTNHVLTVIHEQFGTRNGKKQILAISGDIPISEDNESTTLEQIPDNGAALAFESAEDACFQEELHNALEECLKTLPDDQEKAIRERYYQGHTVEEIAQRMDTDRKAVRNTIARGLLGLRKPINRKRLRPFLDEIRFPHHVGVATFQSVGGSQPERYAEAIQQLHAIS